MSETLKLNSRSAMIAALKFIQDQWEELHYLEIEITRKAGQRTLRQNKALHLFLTQLAETLNDAGFDMKRTLKPAAEIPWTPVSAKEHLWRPVQEALTNKASTTELSTVDPTLIHETLCRHLGQRLGIDCPPWPTKKQED